MMHGHGSALLLLTAVAGYWVLERASERKKGDVRRVGKVVGWLVILVSFIGIACKVWCLTGCGTGYGPMHKMKRGGIFCPYHGAPDSPAAAPAK